MTKNRQAMGRRLHDFVEWQGQENVAPAYKPYIHRNPWERRQEAIGKLQPPPWVPAGKTNNDYFYMSRNEALTRLHEEIKDLCCHLTATPYEDTLRQAVVDDIRCATQSIFPGASVEVYGSFETGLHLPDSDIDLVVRTLPSPTASRGTSPMPCDGESDTDDLSPRAGKDFDSGSDRTETDSYVIASPDTTKHELLATVLKDLPIVRASSVHVVGSARIPIIKFVANDLRVDICFNVSGGPQNAGLVHQYLEEIPALRPLVMALKCFLSQRQLNDTYTGGLSSHAVTIMAICFLQECKLADAENRLGDLLVRFFKYYGCNESDDFHEETQMVTVDGPVNRGEADPMQPSASALMIVDPLHGHNVAAGCYLFNNVKRAFSTAYKALSAAVTGQDMTLVPTLLCTVIAPKNYEGVERKRCRVPPSPATTTAAVDQ